jgi:hypothetical protein
MPKRETFAHDTQTLCVSLGTGFSLALLLVACLSPTAAPVGQKPAVTGGTTGAGGAANTGGVGISLPTGGHAASASNGGSGAATQQCRASLECAPPTPYCVVNPGLCVECLANANCAGTGKRYCDVPRNTCVNCLSDTQCTATAPYCSPEGECVQCLSARNCGSAEAACDPVLHRCVATCSDDGDCNTDPGRSFCNTEIDECVQCIADEDCPPVRAHCLLSVGTCEKCVVDTDCASPTPRCDVKSHACAQCVSNADCQTGYSCQAGSCTIIPE